jgi:hypothetical protein
MVSDAQVEAAARAMIEIGGLDGGADRLARIALEAASKIAESETMDDARRRLAKELYRAAKEIARDKQIELLKTALQFYADADDWDHGLMATNTLNKSEAVEGRLNSYRPIEDLEDLLNRDP